jgi:hypothetical protein
MSKDIIQLLYSEASNPQMHKLAKISSSTQKTISVTFRTLDRGFACKLGVQSQLGWPCMSSLSKLTQQLILQNFQSHRNRWRFMTYRAYDITWREASNRFAATQARGALPCCLECDNYAHSPHLVCAIHPDGPLHSLCHDWEVTP